jgi:hypothetical protein
LKFLLGQEVSKQADEEKMQKESFCQEFALDEGSGLPDGIYSNQKYQFG